MTNGDMLRSMTDEELMQFICNDSDFCDICEHNREDTCCNENCQKTVLKWLRMEIQNAEM